MVSRPPSIEEIKAFKKAFMEGMNPPPTFDLFKGAFVEVDVEGQSLTCSFQPGAELVNPAGMVQGGIISAMMDDTMGPLGLLMSAGKAFPSSTDIHTRYYRGVKPGEKLICVAKISKMGRTICYTEATLTNEKGQEVAHCVQTASLQRLG